MRFETLPLHRFGDGRQFTVRKVSLFGAIFVLGLLTNIGLRVAWADYSNATVAGQWVCAGTTYTAAPDERGGTTWVPGSFVGLLLLDGNGHFSSGKVTMNTQGLVCDFNVDKESAYHVAPDGIVLTSLDYTAAKPNPSKCPAKARSRSTVIIENSYRAAGSSIDVNASGWFVCSKRSGN